MLNDRKLKGINFQKGVGRMHKTKLMDWQYDYIGKMLDKGVYSDSVIYRGWKCIRCSDGIYCIPKAKWIKHKLTTTKTNL